MKKVGMAVLLISIIVINSGCLNSAEDDYSTITLYGFSAPEETLINEIIPDFQEYWKSKTGNDVKLETSFAGSGTVTNQILGGAPAEVVILSHEHDAIRLKEKNKTIHDWKKFQHQGIVTNSPFVIVTRQGNPENISSWEDLGKEGIEVIHADPSTSGEAMWSIFAIYGSALKESEFDEGAKNEKYAEELLEKIETNVVSMPSSAKKSIIVFETGIGDAMITYETEALLLKKADKPYEIIYPRSTIISEHPVVIIDSNVDKEELELVENFVNFLWTKESQNAFANHGFRSVDEIINLNHPEFKKTELPFKVEYLGGWEIAKKNIIDKSWEDIRTNLI